MTTNRRSGGAARVVTLAFGYLAIVHFAFGLYLTLRLAIGIPELWLYFLGFSLPYLGITGIFVASVFLGHRRRIRWSVSTLLLGLIVSVAMCVYDFQNSRYQISGSGHGPDYTIWWWYYEPYWYGYKPGNI